MVLLDDVFPRLSGNATKVLLFIIRKILGWRDKESDDISYSQFRSGAGLSNNSIVSEAIRELEGYVPIKEGRILKGWKRDPELPVLIIVKRNKDSRGGDATSTYRLNKDFCVISEKEPLYALHTGVYEMHTDNRYPSAKKKSDPSNQPPISTGKREAPFSTGKLLIGTGSQENIECQDKTFDDRELDAMFSNNEPDEATKEYLRNFEGSDDEISG